MKIILGLSLIFLSFSSMAQKKVESLDILTSAVCDMCKETLEHDMSFEKGVKKVVLDVDTKVLTVDYNPEKTTPEKLRVAVTNVGYDADDVPANPKKYKRLHPCCKKNGHCEH